MVPRPGFASQATHRGCRTRVHLWMPCPACPRTGRTGTAEQTAPLWRPDATQHRMQNTGTLLRTRVSRAQRLSRLGGSLEEAAGQQRVVGPRHSTILVGRPGQRGRSLRTSTAPVHPRPGPTPHLTSHSPHSNQRPWGQHWMRPQSQGPTSQSQDSSSGLHTQVPTGQGSATSGWPSRCPCTE